MARWQNRLSRWWQVGCALLLTLSVVTGSGCKMAQGNNISGVQFFQQGNYELAANYFQRALQMDSRNADAAYNLAATYHRVGSQRRDQNLFSQAESAYQQCLRAAPDHVECRRGYAVLLMETQRKDQAFAMLRSWAEQNPRSADARIELARLYQETGDLANTERHLQDAVAMDTRNARAWTALGKLREDSGNPQQALSNYQQALASNRFQPGVAQRVAALGQGSSSFSSPMNRSGTRVVDLPYDAVFRR